MSAAAAVESPFLLDIGEIRRRVKSHTDESFGEGDRRSDGSVIVQLLNDAVEAELVCVLRYRRHYYTAMALDSGHVASTFLGHAIEEQSHADRLCQRIRELGGQPSANPARLLSWNAAERTSGALLPDLLREDLAAERITIDTYRSMIRYVSSGDPTTARLLREILASEEVHAEELRERLALLDPHPI